MGAPLFKLGTTPSAHVWFTHIWSHFGGAAREGHFGGAAREGARAFFLLWDGWEISPVSRAGPLPVLRHPRERAVVPYTKNYRVLGVF